MPTPRNPFLAAVGRRVQRLRKARGLTQAELGERAGYSPPFISGIERGVDTPSIETLAHIAEALGTSAAAFLEDPLPDEVDAATQSLLRTLREKQVTPVFVEALREFVDRAFEESGRVRRLTGTERND